MLFRFDEPCFVLCNLWCAAYAQWKITNVMYPPMSLESNRMPHPGVIFPTSFEILNSISMLETVRYGMNTRIWKQLQNIWVNIFIFCYPCEYQGIPKVYRNRRYCKTATTILYYILKDIAQAYIQSCNTVVYILATGDIAINCNNLDQ